MKDFFNKYKIIIIITLIGIVLLLITRSCSRVIENNIRQDIESSNKIENKFNVKNEYVIKHRNDWRLLVNYFLRGLITYDDIPISKKFKNKYPKVSDFIVGKINGAISDDVFDTYKEINNLLTITAKTGRGLEEVAYQLHYVINEKNELDDIEILDSKVIEDENGEFIQYDKYYYYLDCDFSYGLLVRPAVNKPNYLYVSDNFIKKFPEYPNKGVLKDYSYMIVEDLYYDKENPLICWALVMDLEKTTLFKIQVKLDDKGYVDDVDVNIDNVKKTEDPKYVQSVYDEYYS